jgi:hypothetical protein
MSVVRWTLDDGVDTYEFHFNPREMSPLGPKSTMETLGGSIYSAARARETKNNVYEWSFAGRIYSQAQYDSLLEWSRKAQVLTLTDHLGRTWSVVLTEFIPTELRRPGTLDRWDYEMRALVIS